VKTLTVRLPDELAATIEMESRTRKVSKSDVIRERLSGATSSRARPESAFDAIVDLVGSVDGLPPDLSRRKKAYLVTSGYGQKRRR
jgi:Arc/MetJ-type ribon-helix-helix transcriptional regulator